MPPYTGDISLFKSADQGATAIQAFLFFQGLLFTEDLDLTFDVDTLETEEGSQSFASMLTEKLLIKAKSDDKFRAMITGLGKEGLDRKLYWSLLLIINYVSELKI